MILATSSSREALRQVVDVAARLGEALGVREVRPEQDVVDAHAASIELRDVVLVERAHLDVALERLDRVLVERLRHLLVACRRGARGTDGTQSPPFSTDAILQVREAGEQRRGRSARPSCPRSAAP